MGICKVCRGTEFEFSAERNLTFCRICGEIQSGTTEPVKTTLSLQDSGNRRKFESGAVRDISEGKGRCDLLPLDIVGRLVDGDPALILGLIENFKTDKQIVHLIRAIQMFAGDTSKNVYDVMLDVSKHFEAGAEKYDENNWKKGIPLHCYIDSAVRHYLKHQRGDMDEPHDRAFVWNLLCAIWTLRHKPELDDIEADLIED